MAATVPNPSGTAEKFLRLIPGEILLGGARRQLEMLSIVTLFRNDDSICYPDGYLSPRVAGRLATGGGLS